MSDTTLEQVKKHVPNPTGKGGLQERPQDINYGGRPKNSQRVGYWLQVFKDMPYKEFKDYQENKSKDEMYVAESLAYERVKKTWESLDEYKDMIDRTEGKAKQIIEQTITDTSTIDTLKNIAEGLKDDKETTNDPKAG